MNLLLVALSLAAPDAPPSPRALATLAIALGTIEAKAPGSEDYAPAAQGAALEAGTWIRTGAKSACALDLADGSEIRLAENTEFHLAERRKTLLKIGSAFLNVKADGAAPYDIESKFATFSFPAGSVSLSFENRDPKSVEYRTISRTVTTLHVLEGMVRVVGRKDKQNVPGGFMCELVDMQLNTPDPSPNIAIATGWINPLLVARGKESPEVAARVEILYSELGAAPKDDVCEAGLRMLGAWSAPLLIQALKQAAPAAETPRRRAAARVLADVAPPAQGPGLLGLLKDADAEIRASGARALKRLAGKDLGFDEAYWKGADTARGAAAWEAQLKTSPIR